MDLRLIFTSRVQQYCSDTSVSEFLWKRIEANYSKKKRYYHTLKHLDNLIIELTDVKDNIEDWDTILFSVFYHDVVYNVLKNNNEQESAELAANQLKSIDYPKERIALCKRQILSTKDHLISENNDTNFFIDADLSILGKFPEGYEEYILQIRREYSIYPDMIYKPGRRKVVQHFLGMDKIYKTKYFADKYEEQAKQNLLRELSQL